VQAARGRGWARRATQGGSGAVARGWQTVAARRRTAARTGCTRRSGDGGEGEGEGAAKTEDERAAASGQESNMTSGPRGFYYRRLIQCLGFERRLIASV
jgi:hypothetical protein